MARKNVATRTFFLRMGSTRGRLVVPIVVAVLGTGVAFAVTDSSIVSPRTVQPKGEVYPPLGEKNESATAEHGVLGAAGGGA